MFSLARRDPDLIRSEQAPCLARQEMPSPVRVVIGEIALPQARRPAVALIFVGRGTHAEEIGFVITGKLLRRIEVALDKHGDAALPGRTVKFVLMIER